MLSLIEDPGENHVRDMAVYFNAELDESNEASTITMDNEQAKGFISSYRIFSGLEVWVYNIKFHTDFKVDLLVSEDRPYYFSYNVQGHFLHRFSVKEEFTKIYQNQNVIMRGNTEASVQIVFPAHIKLKIAVIKVDQKLLGNLQIRNARRIFTNIEALFRKFPAQHHFRHLGGINVQTEKYASIVCENKIIDLVGGLLTEGAVLNMLASQIKVYKDDIAENQSSLSKTELARITSLGTYVINNLEIDLTIPALSKHTGMSPKKLQEGVKYLYGDSVGHYVLNLRMGHAKHLFNTTDLNISEVCTRVGIANGGYFSKIFKNRFGKLPSQYHMLQQIKKRC